MFNVVCYSVTAPIPAVEEGVFSTLAEATAFVDQKIAQSGKTFSDWQHNGWQAWRETRGDGKNIHSAYGYAVTDYSQE